MKNIISIVFLSLALMIFNSCESEKAIISQDLTAGNWELTQQGNDTVFKAKVPGSVHMDLFANGAIPDPYYRNNEKELQWIGEEDWVYNTEFLISEEVFNMSRIELEFKGLDTYADVYINDSLVLQADNFFKEWNLNAKNLLNLGPNTMEIVFWSAVNYCEDAEKNCPIPIGDDYAYSRKPAYHFGWDWGPTFITAGIWRPIELHAWNDVRITNLQIVQEGLSDEKAELKFVYEIEAEQDENVDIITRNKDLNLITEESIDVKKGLNIIESHIIIENPKRWWSYGLGEAYLYEFASELRIGNSIVDEISERIGLRTVELVQKPDSIGKTFHFELNGVPVFMKGANYIPQDLFVNRPTAENYQEVIDNTLAANMNMLRVWGGGFYENDIFYDLCDENGILVWQDFMFACSMYPGDEDFLQSVKEEAIQNVKRLRNHPSIALWCGNNENYIGWQDWRWSSHMSKQDSATVWQDYEKLFHELLPEVISKFDEDRFYWPSSPLFGWGYPVNTEGDVHYWGIWHAQEPFENFQKPEFIGRFMSEYGFQGCPEMSSIKKFTIPEDRDINSEVMLAHQKHRIGYPVIDKYMDWYYKKPKDFEAYLYVSQVQQAFGMGIAFEAHRRAMPHCMGTLYWQINDCYPVTSWSSVDSYGKWKALHYKTRELYKEVMLSPYVSEEKLDIYVVSDRLTDIHSQFKLKLYNLKGVLLKESSEELIIPANSSHICFSQAAERFLEGHSKQKVVLRTQILENNEIIAENDFFFELPKNLQLDEPDIKVKSKKLDQGYELTFTCQSFAKDVYLSTDDGNGFFSNNFFNIIPNIPVKIMMTEVPENFNVDHDLKLYSLKESYN